MAEIRENGTAVMSPRVGASKQTSSDAIWRSRIADLQKAVKACLRQGGNNSKYCQMTAIYAVAWQADRSGELDSLMRHCAAKLSRKERVDSSIFHLLLTITGPRAPQTVSTWAKALVRAKRNAVTPKKVFNWLQDEGLKARARSPARKSNPKPVTTKKKPGGPTKPWRRTKTVVVSPSPTRQPGTAILPKSPTGRSAK
jgi:hypothetical protein